jgi:hypothetical protein
LPEPYPTLPSDQRCVHGRAPPIGDEECTRAFAPRCASRPGAHGDGDTAGDSACGGAQSYVLERS